jgi:hypothetical protein
MSEKPRRGAQERGERASPSPSERATGSRLDAWIEPYFRDSTLWPVLVVAAAILVTLAAALLLLALVERDLYAIAALLAAGWISGDFVLRDVRGHGRVGLAGGTLLALWAMGAVAAAVARGLGFF